MVRKIIKLKGLHCVSCAIDIDSKLEDLKGVKVANTHYAQQKTEIFFDEKKTSEDKIIKVIKELGYETVN